MSKIVTANYIAWTLHAKMPLRWLSKSCHFETIVHVLPLETVPLETFHPQQHACAPGITSLG